MPAHVLERQQWLPAARAEAFRFFADACNLEAITPPWLHFRIESPLPIEMREGTRIDYRLRLASVPLRWRTRITAWQPGLRFVDTQERGPYRLWEHLHAFEAHGEGTLMTDRVRYGLPLGPLGSIAHAVAVRSALAAIFDHRYQRIAERFARAPAAVPRPAQDTWQAKLGVA